MQGIFCYLKNVFNIDQYAFVPVVGSINVVEILVVIFERWEWKTPCTKCPF